MEEKEINQSERREELRQEKRVIKSRKIWIETSEDRNQDKKKEELMWEKRKSKAREWNN